MPGPVSISTLGSLQVREAGGWRAAGGGLRGMVASASNSFLPVLEQMEEKKEADVSGKDSDNDKAGAEDSIGVSPQTNTGEGTPVKPLARMLPLTIEAEEDDDPLVKGWTARDLTVLMRNKSAVDDDVHALQDDEYMYRLPPMILPPCTEKDITVTVPREWLVRLHQRLESMNGEGDSELYPVILQVRPIDTDALPSKQTSGSPVAAVHRLEEKEKASDWEDATTKGGGTNSEQRKQEDALVTELTLLEFQSAKTEASAAGASPVSPRSPRRLLSFPSRPSSPSTSRPLSPSINSASSAPSSPVASFEEYLRHIRLCRQLIIPPSGSVYCVEELFGVDASSSPDCLVCLTERKDVLLLPCRHASICHTCHKSVTRCPVCRSGILSYMRWVDEEQVWRELGVPGSIDATKVNESWKGNPHPGLLPEMPAAAALKGSQEDDAVEMAAMSPTSGRTADGGEGGGRPIEQETEEGKDAADALLSAAEPFPVFASAEKRGSESEGRVKSGLALADVEMADLDGTLAAPNSPAGHTHQ